jgi:hypothetical protein
LEVWITQINFDNQSSLITYGAGKTLTENITPVFFLMNQQKTKII